MPVLTQLKLNIGTEQNPNMVLHDLHDIRISSTDVTTVTRLLGCDAGVNSIAPLTLANAASLLGGGANYVNDRLIGIKEISLQPNETANLAGQCGCVIVYADIREFNGTKMVTTDTEGVHVVYDYSTQGGFDSYLRFFGSNELNVENISEYTLSVRYIRLFG